MTSILTIPPGTKIHDGHMGRFDYLTVIKVEPLTGPDDGLAQVWTEQYEKPFNLDIHDQVTLYTAEDAAFSAALLHDERVRLGFTGTPVGGSWPPARHRRLLPRFRGRRRGNRPRGGAAAHGEQPRPDPDVEHLAAGAVAVGGLVQRLAQVNRGAFWPDGRTRESDTDHSMSVALVAAYLAERLCPHADLSRVLGYGLVHDMVEVYAGDTWTLALDEQGREAKTQREDAAVTRLVAEFSDTFPWLAQLLTEYAEMQTLEARFVYGADKIASKLPNLTSLQATLDLTGATTADCTATWDRQSARLAELIPECPALAAVNTHLAQQTLP